MLFGFFLALMSIKLAEQVFLSRNSITRINGRSKEFALALRTACHCGNFALESQNDEATLCHGTQCGTVVVASPVIERDSSLWVTEARFVVMARM